MGISNKPFPLKKYQWGAAAITTAFLFLATVYSVFNPIFEAPDELWHYAYVWHVSQTGTLPTQDPTQPQLWAHEGSQAPLYYLLAGLLTAPLPNDDLAQFQFLNPYADIGSVTADGNQNIAIHTVAEKFPWHGVPLAVHLARFLSILLGTGTVLSVYALGRTLWASRPAFALLAMAFVAFNPQFLFISASASNDAMINFAATFTLWWLSLFVTSFIDKTIPYRQFIILGLWAGIAALSKLSGVGLLALIGVTLLWMAWRQHQWRIAIFGNLLVGATAFVVAGWWYVRNIILYQDWSGNKTILAIMSPRQFSPTISQWGIEISGLAKSFFGVFGYFSILMPAALYWFFGVILLTGIIGLAIAVFKKQRAKMPKHFWALASLLFLWLLLMFAGLVQYTLLIPSSQGRLLFPAIGAIAILWAAGWMTIVPARWHFSPVPVMFAVAIWLPWGIIRPAYALPTFMDTVPATAQKMDATFGDAVRLLAYQSETSTVHPGGTVPITLYWQRNGKSIDKDYTLFVHLLDDNDLVIAQRDMFHGRGNYPTGQWNTDKIFADTYVLKIPQTTFAPSHARFEVGLYDRTTGIRLPLATGGDNIRFGVLDIRPEKNGTIPNPQDLHFDEGISLVGYTISPHRALSGGKVTLTLYWRSDGTPSQNYKVFVHLINDGNMSAGQDDSEPNQGKMPTAEWTSGQIIVDPHTLEISPDVSAGGYRFVVGLYDGVSGMRLNLRRNGQKNIQADSITLGGIRIDGE